MNPRSCLRWGAAALSLCACTLYAQTPATTTITDHDAHHNTAPVATTTAQDSTEGVIRRVDTGQSKVTIKHGPIKHMDMPGMTMVFTAKDKALLANVKPGDKVEFMVINEGGKMIVTDLKGAR